MEDIIDILDVFVQFSKIDDNSIKVDEACMLIILAELHIQGSLERGWSVDQTKWHALNAIDAGMGFKCSFVLVFILYRNLPVPPVGVQRRKNARIP